MKKIYALIFTLFVAGSSMAQSRLEIFHDCEKGVAQINGVENGYAWVDLGLSSGLKWATCNVGAANPWDCGDYFAWGETVGYGKSDPSNAHNYAYGNTYVKTYYYWDTYKWCSGTSGYTLTKYNNDIYYGSVVDNNAVLDLADDAARANMGGSWRMPTRAEQNELIGNCYCEWTDSYNGKGVKGYIVYKVKDASDKGKAKLLNEEGKYSIYGIDEDGMIFAYDDYLSALAASYSLSDVHIFLPAAGCRNESDLDYAGANGYYWSSSLGDYYGPMTAYDLYFDSGCVVPNDSSYRYYGQSVRGVYDSDDTTAIDNIKTSESANTIKCIDDCGNVRIVLPNGRVYNVVGAGIK